jgi:hypothetical protein
MKTILRILSAILAALIVRDWKYLRYGKLDIK